MLVVRCRVGYNIDQEAVASHGLLSLKFQELWARMLVHSTESYLLVLRLVVFMLLLLCERPEDLGAQQTRPRKLAQPDDLALRGQDTALF